MIETHRLILTPPVPADLDDSHAMLSDAGAMRFIGGHALSREDVWNKLLRNIGHWQVFGYGLFTIREKETGHFVGETGLAHFGRNLGDSLDPFPEAAWILSSEHHGQGYAIEAAQAAHDWMTKRQNPSKTVCIINPDNLPSIGIANKLGYHPFGNTSYRGGVVILFSRQA